MASLSLLAGLLSLALTPLSAEEKNTPSQVITIETATLRGNQELPTVLYLVPWQAPDINPLPATQSQVFSHQLPEKIERHSFRRLIEYSSLKAIE
jgi:hypothetical protein